MSFPTDVQSLANFVPSWKLYDVDASSTWWSNPFKRDKLLCRKLSENFSFKIVIKRLSKQFSLWPDLRSTRNNCWRIIASLKALIECFLSFICEFMKKHCDPTYGLTLHRTWFILLINPKQFSQTIWFFNDFVLLVRAEFPLAELFISRVFTIFSFSLISHVFYAAYSPFASRLDQRMPKNAYIRAWRVWSHPNSYWEISNLTFINPLTLQRSFNIMEKTVTMHIKFIINITGLDTLIIIIRFSCIFLPHSPRRPHIDLFTWQNNSALLILWIM